MVAMVPTTTDQIRTPKLAMSTGSVNSSAHLTGGRLLAKNTGWNLAGQLLPMFVAVVSIPQLIRGIGVDRFGILSMAWIVISYFSLFDLGIGRAVTKLVAEKIGGGEEHAIAPLAWTAMLLMLLLGVTGALTTAAISPWLVRRVLKVPVILQGETLLGFYLLAISIPLVTIASGFRGILEAKQHFRVLNLIRIPMSTFSFAGPLLVLPFSHRLPPIIGILVVGRLIGCLAHQFACLHAMPVLRNNLSIDRTLVKPLLKFGGWMSITNLLGPMMQSMDRFLIGSLISVSAVAYYTAPLDMLSRLAIVPQAVVGVLFPAFAMTCAQDTSRTELLLSRSLKYIFFLIFPVTLVVVALAPEGLGFWLGPEFSQHSAAVVRWLAVGIFVNSLSTVPFVLLQSLGRPDVTTKLVAAELPLYLLTLWVLTRRFGIEGSAIAWTFRLVLEAVFVFICVERLLPTKPKFLPKLWIGVVGGLAALCAASIAGGLLVRVGFLSCALLMFAGVSWSWGLGPRERAFLFRPFSDATSSPQLR
jgi:O-antigen/teichoic acid export membrane protein